MSLDITLTRDYLGNPMPLSPDATNGVVGGAPGQTLTGKRGVSNWIISDGGGSILIGGDLGDTFYVRDPNDVVIAAPNSGINTIVSWTSSYTLPANVQNLFLQSGSGGTGVGNNLNNLLVAEGPSNYTLVAGTGNDVMIGNGSGDPQFDTGAGSTTFVISKGDGNDVIANFRNGIDVVRLNNFSTLTSLTAVQAAMTQVGSDVVLNLGGGETLTFRNATIANFQASDFMLPAYLPGMSLTFDDEFNSFVSSPTGTQGWMTQGGAYWRTLSGNNEAEYYSDPSVGVNPFSDANGVLTITAAPGPNPLGLPYNSGIITTETSFNFEYGLIEVSAKLPAGAGLWPAIWLLPSSLGWPPEIDIMEMLGSDPTTIYASTHSGSDNDSSTLPVYVGDTTQAFHTYGLDWEPNSITWYFDGNAIRTVATPSDMHQPMYLLINLAVGGAGSWPGAPTSSSEFPAQMSIDYVRIYGSSATTAVSGTDAQAPSPPTTIIGATATSGSGPVVSAVTISPANGDLTVGAAVTLSVTFSSTVTVTGGTPTLALNGGGTATYASGSGSAVLVFSYVVAAGQNTADLALATGNAVALNGATIRDAAGNSAVLTGANGYNPAGTLQVDTNAPTITAIATSPGSGQVNAGTPVTLMVTFSEAVTVAGGTPTLALNDGGTATYVSGSGSAVLVFSYTVATGQNTADLALAISSAVVLSGATIRDGAGNNAVLTGANGYSPAGTLQVDTIAPTITAIATSPGSGQVAAGATIALTVTFSEAVTVTGGTPALALNDGGTATYVSGSGSTALRFSYVVAAGQNAADLALAASNAVALNGATIRDAAGNGAVLTGANGYNPAGTLQVDTTAPTVTAIVTSPGSGQVAAGATVTLTVTFSEAVTVAGGTPALALNDGGTATYASGSGSAVLVFSYVVAAGQNTADLALAASNAIALNGATIRDAAGNSAVLTGANGYSPAGMLRVETNAPTVTAITTSPGSGNLAAGATVSLTVTFSEAVTVIGGAPTLALNDGGTAAYVSGSGTTALIFSYAVAAGQDAADLALATNNAIALNGATLRDAAGNSAVLTGANGYNPAGTLQIDTVAPTVSAIATSPGTGQLATGGSVKLTVTFSEVVTLTGGTPTLTLNDGGTATYVSGSGSNALVFSYTVAAGQSTADLALAASNAIALKGAAIRDAAGNSAVLTGANGYNPTGTLQINSAVINTVVSGWWNTYNLGSGIYNVSGTAGGAQITLGDGNQTVNVTGTNNTLKTGNGNQTITFRGDSNIVVTGAGASTINLIGSYENVTVGATPTGTTTISTTGFGEEVASSGKGNVVIIGPNGNSTVKLADGDDTVTLGGSGNNVTVGVGTSTINVGIGQGIVHAGGGSDTIIATGWNNLLDAGPGMNFIHGGNGNDTFVLNAAGQGLDTIFGFAVSNSDKLDLTRTLASVAPSVDLTNVGSYITASTSGGNTTLYVDPTGGHGTPYAFASLQAISATVAQLVAHHDLIVP
jgi:beta-glucanase (GH16 family)